MLILFSNISYGYKNHDFPSENDKWYLKPLKTTEHGCKIEYQLKLQIIWPLKDTYA